ncbi:class I SAM-dependent methyltransferase [Desulfonatronovibrio hydrogenovorans]|uniref:class I SAM-dependent methyltransferase n=1 Tax=Desulfonatronovibrio hydrogenovorans TaxID=53245 RepID=UPI000491892B|nr:class I SAM-dependent methyltransferase [Desulfonatronovibrio hydrogenovorans]
MILLCSPSGSDPTNRSKADFFDAQANAPWANDHYTQVEMQKIEKVLASLPDLEGMTILEPGCGTGRLTRILASRVGSRGRILAVDISAKMIKNAKRNLQDLDNVLLSRAGLESIDLEPGQIDIAFCHQVFPHFDCKKTALKILTRSLKPGGLLVILHLIGLQKINDTHRKAGTAVAHDLMPGSRELKGMLTEHFFELEYMEDLEDLFFVLARKN